LDRLDNGKPLPPELSYQDLPEDWRDEIYHRHSQASKLRRAHEKVMQGIPFPYITRSKVEVEVHGPAPLLAKYDSQIPQHWKTIPV
jgi:hypothetical protein